LAVNVITSRGTQVQAGMSGNRRYQKLSRPAVRRAFLCGGADVL